MTLKINLFRFAMALCLLLGAPFFLKYRETLTGPKILAFSLFFGFYLILGIVVDPLLIKVSYAFMLIGAILNQVVIFCNGWCMPVAHMNTLPHGIWRQMLPTDHLKYLCDVLPGQSSVGDWILGFSMLFGLGVVCYRSISGDIK